MKKILLVVLSASLCVVLSLPAIAFGWGGADASEIPASVVGETDAAPVSQKTLFERTVTCPFVSDATVATAATCINAGCRAVDDCCNAFCIRSIDARDGYGYQNGYGQQGSSGSQSGYGYHGYHGYCDGSQYCGSRDGYYGHRHGGHC